MILTSADVVDHVAKEIEKASGTPAPDGRRDTADNGKTGKTGNQRKRNGSLISNGDDGSMPDLEIVGPTGTIAFLHSLRHFMRRDRFHVRTHEGKYDSSLDKNASNRTEERKRKERRRVGTAVAKTKSILT